MKLVFYILLLAFTHSVTFANSQTNQRKPHFQKVIYLVLENKDYQDVLKNELFRKWSQQGALFTQFYAETHPSQPNYIAMIAGDLLGVDSNSNVSLNENHLGDLLEEKNLQWKLYAEDYPGHCYLEKKAGSYARKHVPFLSFRKIQETPERCNRVVNFRDFSKDLESGQLPHFSMIIPNNKNNGHDTDINTSALWIDKNFEGLLSNSQLMNETLFIITYDEGSSTSDNKIFTLFLGGSVISGSQNSDSHNHYSLIRLLEDEWGLNQLNRHDSKAPSILGIWN